ncbi:protein Z, vitamin K-dependent plasma glycoprotein b [Diretmus argenteus]
MSPGRRASVFSLSLLACFLQVLSQGAVFRGPAQARSIFLRSKRANSFLLEELLQGNLERECYEELCTYEEAREYFEDHAKTISFWTRYHDGDQCEPNPCLHGGNCTDMVGGFWCSCSEPHHGQLCELGGLEEQPANPVHATPVSQCPTDGPTSCHQFCSVTFDSFSCSCTDGFKLQTDGRSCLPAVEFPCGTADKLNASGPICRHGNCPWQVSLLGSSGMELCEGVVLGRRSVLTSARCLFLGSGSDRQPSNLHVIAVIVPVQTLYIHRRFHRDRHDDDLVLLQLAIPLTFGPTLFHLCLPTKDFSENILMHSGRTGLTGELRDGTMNSDPQSLVYVTLDDCRSQLNVSHPISNKMFCMRSQNGATGKQDGRQSQNKGRSQTPVERQSRVGTQNGRERSSESVRPKSSLGAGHCGLSLGTPVATEERGTAFLTGLLTSSPTDCGGGGGDQGLVFTKLSRYLTWIRQTLDLTEGDIKHQLNEHPEGH